MMVRTKESIVERDIYIPAGETLEVVEFEDGYVLVQSNDGIISHYLFSVNDRRIEIQWET